MTDTNSMKHWLPALLICFILLAVMPVLAADDYLGGGIQLGGSGIRITEVPTTASPVITAEVPPVLTTGILSVTTTPAGATVFIDGIPMGVSPVTISGLAPGGHAMILKLDGYADITAPVTVTAGQTQAYTAGLVPVATPVPAIPAVTKSPGFEEVLCIAAIGAALAAGKRQ